MFIASPLVIARFVFPNGLCTLQSDDTRCLTFYFALDSDFQQPQKPLTGNFVANEANVAPVVYRSRENTRRGLSDSSGDGFDPSRCGGHKYSENAATFPKFLGRRKNLDSVLTCNRQALSVGVDGERYERGLEHKRGGGFMPRGRLRALNP